MRKIFNLALGIVTSIGGFVEVGSISTSVQAGAEFGFSLLWAVAAATLFLAALAEMAGRVAAVSRQSMAAAVRERFGFHFQIVPLGAELVIDTLLLTAELGGAAIAVKMLTGIDFEWWVLPAGILAWLVLWFGNFSVDRRRDRIARDGDAVVRRGRMASAPGSRPGGAGLRRLPCPITT